MVTRQHVVTAAHCLVKGVSTQNLFVRLGGYDLGIDQEQDAIDVGISRIIVHENYDRTTHVNDIAVLKLSKPVDITDTTNSIRAVCLPSKDETFEKHNATVGGWGATEYGK